MEQKDNKRKAGMVTTPTFLGIRMAAERAVELDASSLKVLTGAGTEGCNSWHDLWKLLKEWSRHLRACADAADAFVKVCEVAVAASIPYKEEEVYKPSDDFET